MTSFIPFTDNFIPLGSKLFKQLAITNILFFADISKIVLNVYQSIAYENYEKGRQPNKELGTFSKEESYVRHQS